MAFTTDTRDALLNGLDTLATYASLHTADPGETGDSEVTGGAYARQPITWEPAAAGSKTLTASVTFDVPSGVTVTHAGTWDSDVGGMFRGSAELSSPETFGAAGTATVSLTATLT